MNAYACNPSFQHSLPEEKFNSSPYFLTCILKIFCGVQIRGIQKVHRFTYGILGLLKVSTKDLTSPFFDFPQRVVLEDEDRRASSQVSHQHLLSDVKACCIDLRRHNDSASHSVQTIPAA
ncbi:hypothetical protein CDAR_402051 [Caerostris darwini]|uniref:Uncharacterized protein n=1 Tax=Caerostris darwini TaxID=1538125 RepID=A0AAV4T0Z7_9ARAC|nr:hypothetical protein CDAR_402051 [Caerostris darwini]